MSKNKGYVKRMHPINSVFQNKSCVYQRYLLSSCSRVILIVSGLWFTQASPLRAMDLMDTTPDRIAVKLRSDKKSAESTKFYQDVDHPLTQEFWKKLDLSERILGLKKCIDPIKDDIISHKKDLAKHIEEHFEEYRNILSCTKCTPFFPISNLKDIHLNEKLDFSIDRDRATTPNGWSGANVVIFPSNQVGTTSDLVAIKRFFPKGDIEPTKIEEETKKAIKTGLKELIESLIALEMNPAPEKFKMARIYDAVICPQNSLSIVMEAVGTRDIHTFLLEDKSLNAENSINVVRACAEYLANFHIENHRKINETVERKEYLKHVASFFNSLTQDSLEEQHSIYKLLDLNPKEKLSGSKKIQSDNVILLLDKDNQKKINHLIETCKKICKGNAETIYRASNGREARGETVPYFLTLNHGDGHAHNFFYNNSVLKQNGSSIPDDSFLRISMIDFATLVKTTGCVGDPAEDIGRFLAALRNWWVLHPEDDTDKNEKIKIFQETFLDCYLQKIKDSGIINGNQHELFEEIFKENCSLYKLRYYRAIFNVPKHTDPTIDRTIKRKFLESWIEENSHLENQYSKPQYIRKEAKDRHWGDPVCAHKREIVHWLPERPLEFIESAAEEGSQKSYLTCLLDILKANGTATLVGMGGVGKTSHALEYAHEALKQKAYNVIHWIHSSSELSLIKGYRDLLQKMGFSTQNKEDEQIITLFKRELPKWGKCLLIYDNVPNAKFLKDKIPVGENIHRLMTSRSKEEWQNPLCLGVFRLEDSLNYFFQVTGLENKAVVGELAQDLGRLPLALAHAAHYIKLEAGNKATPKHFKQYLDCLRQQPTVHFEENRNLFTERKSELTYEHLIHKTLEIAKQKLLPIAEKLLNYCAYLAPDSIDQQIISRVFSDNAIELQKALQQLSDLSLIKRADQEFSIHRLVQLVLRNVQKSGEHPKYCEILPHMVSVFNELFENNLDTSENIDKLIKNFPHFLELLEHTKTLKLIGQVVEKLEWAGKLSYLIVEDENIRLENENTRHFYDSSTGDLESSSQKKRSNQKIKQLLQKAQSFFDKSIVHNDLPTWLLDIISISHSKVQLILGYMYQREIFVNEDYKKAIEWKKRAAKIGYAPAQFSVGDAYLDGEEIKKNYPKAIKWYQKAAEQKYPLAQTRLGWVYHLGEGVTKDLRETRKWYELAAQQGYAPALFNMGTLYDRGEGVKKNYVKAFKWYKQAAERGHQKAQLNLGLMYDKGEGVEHNEKQAFNWIKKAAKQGQVQAQIKLGNMYSDGKGVIQNKAKAFKWYKRAGKQENASAQFKVGYLYERLYERDRIEKNSIKAVKWYKRSAKQGNSKAQLNLGWMYKEGNGVVKDHTKSIKWYKQAAKQGNVHAQYRLGNMHEEGVINKDDSSIRKDKTKAIKWYKKAAAQGYVHALRRLNLIDTNGDDVNQDEATAFHSCQLAAERGDVAAQCKLGTMYFNGDGVTQNHQQALKWYKLAAEKGSTAAQYNLGTMYDSGNGVIQNNEEAFKWYKLAAEQGYPDAQCAVGIMYFNGDGITQNQQEALRWYKLAAKKGDVDAQYNIGLMYAEGDGVEQDKAEALRWYKMAANQGHKKAKKIISSLIPSNIQDNFENPPQSISLTLEQQKLSEEDKRSVAQRTLQNNKNFLTYKLLGDAYISSALLLEELEKDKNNSFIEYLIEKAAEKYILALDSKVPQELQKEEKIKERISCETSLLTEHENNKKKEQVPNTKAANLYTLQGDAYMTAAIQHANEGQQALATHLVEEGNKKYELAEDAQLAMELQGKENK